MDAILREIIFSVSREVHYTTFRRNARIMDAILIDVVPTSINIHYATSNISNYIHPYLSVKLFYILKI